MKGIDLVIPVLVILTGLMLSRPNNYMIERFWTSNPILRIVFGLSQLIGVALVIGSVLYFSFTEHWWYAVAYIGLMIVAKMIAYVISRILYPLRHFSNSVFDNIMVNRVASIVIILVGVISYIGCF